jgi:hypothetical protein
MERSFYPISDSPIMCRLSSISVAAAVLQSMRQPYTHNLHVQQQEILQVQSDNSMHA